MNQAIVDRINPDDLRCTGAVPQEKLAYRMRWVAETETGDSKKSDLANITSALKHAGANLESFWYHDADQEQCDFNSMDTPELSRFELTTYPSRAPEYALVAQTETLTWLV